MSVAASIEISDLAGARSHRRGCAWALLQRDGHCGELGREHCCWGSVLLASLGVSTLADSRPQRRAWAWALLLVLGTIGELGREHSC